MTCDIATVTDPSPSCGLGEPHVGGAGIIQSSSYGGGTLTAKVKFPEGLDVRFRVNVDDQAGNFSETTELSIRIDLGRPTARVLDLVNGGSLHPFFECHHVRIEAFDRNGLSAQWLEVDGQRYEVVQIMGSTYGTCVPVLQQGQIVVRAPLKLSRGGHVLVAKAVDNAGRSAASDPVYIGVSTDPSLSFLLANIKAPTPFASPADLQTAMQNINPMALSEEDWVAAHHLLMDIAEDDDHYDLPTQIAARNANLRLMSRQDLVVARRADVRTAGVSLVLPLDMLNKGLAAVAERDDVEGFLDGEGLPELYGQAFIPDIDPIHKKKSLIGSSTAFWGSLVGLGTSQPLPFAAISLALYLTDYDIKIRRLKFKLATLPEGEKYFDPFLHDDHFDINVHIPFSNVIIADGHLEFEPVGIGSWCSTSLSGADFKEMDISFTLHPDVTVDENGIGRFKMFAPGGVSVNASSYANVKCIDNSKFFKGFRDAFRDQWEKSINEQDAFGDQMFVLGCGGHMTLAEGKCLLAWALNPDATGDDRPDLCKCQPRDQNCLQALGEDILQASELPKLSAFCAVITSAGVNSSPYCSVADMPVRSGLTPYDPFTPCVNRVETPNCFFDDLALLEKAGIHESLGSTLRFDATTDDAGSNAKSLGVSCSAPKAP